VAIAEWLNVKGTLSSASLLATTGCPTEIAFVSPHNITDEARRVFPIRACRWGQPVTSILFDSAVLAVNTGTTTAPAAGNARDNPAALGCLWTEVRALVQPYLCRDIRHATTRKSPATGKRTLPAQTE
jgi:hypothetical protein